MARDWRAADRHGHGEAHRRRGAHSRGERHSHPVAPDADPRYLTAAMALIVGFMVVEVTVGLLAGSVALLADAAHMVTDAGAIGLALFAVRLAARPPSGGYTYGLTRTEILSAQANGLALLLLAGWLGYEAVRRLISPPPVAGAAVLVTAAVGIAVNLAAAFAIGRANRASLNIEGAFQHVITDMYAFVATAVAGAVILITDFRRADAAASLVVVGLMIRSGIRLVRDAGRIFLEAAPTGIDPAELGNRLAATPGVVELHDLHVWQVTSGYPALSAHVLVVPGGDCHAVRRTIERLLRDVYRIVHSTLQVDHVDEHDGVPGAGADPHCVAPHGATYRPAPPCGPPSRHPGNPPGYPTRRPRRA